MALHPEGVSSTEFFRRLAAHSVVASEATQNEKQDRSKTSSISIMMVSAEGATSCAVKRGHGMHGAGEQVSAMCQ